MVKVLVTIRLIIPLFICLLGWPTLSSAGEKATSDKPPVSNPQSLPDSEKKSLNQQPSLPKDESDKQYLFEGISSPLMNSTFNYLDRAQSWLGSYVENLGESADAFFGSEEDFDRTRGSRLDIMTPLTFHANGKIDARVKVRGKLELPRTSKRWNLIIQSTENSLEDYSGNGSASPTATTTKANDNNDSAASVGLRYMLEAKNYTSSFVDFGLNFRGILPDPFARIKGTYRWQLSDQVYSRMVQNLFWESYAGVGLNSKQIFDYQLNQTNLLRSETQGTWWDKEQYYELHQTFYYYQAMNAHRAVGYHVGWDWDTQDTGFHLISYHAGFNWRERIYKKWLFFEVQPRVDFNQETGFRQADPNITFMLEAQFYDRRFEPKSNQFLNID